MMIFSLIKGVVLGAVGAFAVVAVLYFIVWLIAVGPS